jgi:Fe-S-cluster containining protein
MSKESKAHFKMYENLPKIECKGLCHTNCSVIPFSEYEYNRQETHPPKVDKMRCGYLTPENRCSIYEKRPLTCRLFGLVKKMQCHHGCVPERFLTEQEEKEIKHIIY